MAASSSLPRMRAHRCVGQGQIAFPGWNLRRPPARARRISLAMQRSRRRFPSAGTFPAVRVLPSAIGGMRNGETHMSDPRYTDPLNNPRRPGERDPADPAARRRLELEDDSGRGTMWAWIVGIIAIIVVAMLVYDYNKPISSTASNSPATSSPSTTGAAPPAPPRPTPPAAAPTPAPATPAPANPAPATPAPSPGDSPR